MKKILVVEDEASIRTMLRVALELADFEVIEASGVSAAKKALIEKIPDLILLDWMLPTMSGEVFTKQLKRDKRYRQIPIIMLTARAEEEHKIRGLEAGVDDYVVKPFAPKELIARIKAVLRRGLLETPDGKVTIRELTVETISQRVSIAGKSIQLAPVEYRLLVFFLSHQNRVYSRDELLDYVWGKEAYLDQRTVDVHIRRLRKRIALGGHDKLIQTVHGSGYRFSDEIKE